MDNHGRYRVELASIFCAIDGFLVLACIISSNRLIDRGDSVVVVR